MQRVPYSKPLHEEDMLWWAELFAKVRVYLDFLGGDTYVELNDHPASIGVSFTPEQFDFVRLLAWFKLVCAIPTRFTVKLFLDASGEEVETSTQLLIAAQYGVKRFRLEVVE
jgi:hypothetical protein